MEYKLSKEKVIERALSLMGDANPWEQDNAEERSNMLYYVDGIRTMTQEVCEMLEELNEIQKRAGMTDTGP